MHFFDPVAEAVQDHSADNRMIRVECVSRAAVIRVARAILFENVVGGVVQAAKTQGRPIVIAFRSVVEHNVKNDLDAFPVQRLDQIAKLIQRPERIFSRTIRLVWRKE
ncbi:MAG: hypothetical protein Udaeo2_17390 [Candidatus Udaeobacter sp.]|nr:MAG: hypothetical protein Udaeo2_17390 [Candidatus Udaeobacter sp.]